jgi:hypothetical protein
MTDAPAERGVRNGLGTAFPAVSTRLPLQALPLTREQMAVSSQRWSTASSWDTFVIPDAEDPPTRRRLVDPGKTIRLQRLRVISLDGQTRRHSPYLRFRLQSAGRRTERRHRVLRFRRWPLVQWSTSGREGSMATRKPAGPTGFRGPSPRASRRWFSFGIGSPGLDRNPDKVHAGCHLPGKPREPRPARGSLRR